MSKPDGKQLERFVAFVEETLVPQGFAVKINDKVFDDEGNQIAEFDVEVRGKVGTGEMAWLIECRDRPASGAAPGSWIEQLYGRKAAYGFNKVTAVSTTGFAPGAVQNGEKLGIDLRELKSLDPKDLSWLKMEALSVITQGSKLAGINVILDPELGKDGIEAANEVIGKFNAATEYFQFESGPKFSAIGLMNGLGQANPQLWAEVPLDGQAVRQKIMTKGDPADRFFIETKLGRAYIQEFRIEVDLSREISYASPETFRYQKQETGETISEIAKFNFVQDGRKFAFELHNIADTKQTHMQLRFLGNEIQNAATKEVAHQEAVPDGLKPIGVPKALNPLQSEEPNSEPSQSA